VKIPTSALEVARRFQGAGVTEVEGAVSHPLILAMLQMDNKWVKDDSTPWCSAFANFVAFFLGLPRSRSLAARSWLKVGTAVALSDAEAANDVVILRRGSGAQPGPEVLNAPGHVAFYAGQGPGYVEVVGGNQSDSVTTARFPVSQILGIRRLA
jgi:uncharacterized protein (TIGR02594 family)